MRCKMVFWDTQLPSSQTASHLNKAPIQIQSLSLLMGSGGDRQKLENADFSGFTSSFNLL